MGGRGSALADQYERVIKELVETVEKFPDARWQANYGDEGWTVAATAHHVASQLPLEREYLDAAAAGAAMPSYTWDQIHERNAKHAADFNACSKADVVKLLRENASSAAAFVRGLTDEQLDRASPLPLADGAQVTTQQLIEGGVLIDHAASHLKSLRAAAG